MSHHIKRVYSFRITADEINQIMGCRPNKLTDSDIEFMNNIIDAEMDAFRNSILSVITHGKHKLKEHRAKQERIQSALKQERDRHYTRVSWLQNNPDKKLVYCCNTCDNYQEWFETPEQHLEKFGHEATGFQSLEKAKHEIRPISDEDIVSAD